jgi:hypothetical protein
LAGKWFAMSYAGPGFGKFFTKSEIGALHAMGLSVVILAERFGDSALDGYGEGQSQAREADAMSFGWGLPADRPIYFAIDFDMQVSQRPAVRAFLDGCASIVGRDRVGVYGGIRTTEWAANNRYASWFYQTYAWSGTELGPAAHVYQYRNDQWLGGAQVDLDRAIQTDFGQWPHPVESIGRAPTSTPAPVVDTSSWDFAIDVASISDSLTSSAAAIAGAARSINALRG